jgi:arachidonate 5-lipoxygenase
VIGNALHPFSAIIVNKPAFSTEGRLMRRLFDKFVLWASTFFFGMSLLIVQSFIRRRKMSHNNGLAAAGRLQIVDDPQFPAAEFFEPGREFPCRIRHASAAFMDDAMLLVRAASIKFSDNAVESPLDIEMNTGRSLFWSAWNFFQFVKNQHEHGGIQYVSYYRKFPAGRDAAQDSVGRNPPSYAGLDYRSQCPFLFHARDGKRRYVNFRMIPAVGSVEALVNQPDQIGWFFGDQRILPGDPRNRNYLKHEYAERLKRGPIEYTLQLQLHEATDHDSELIFCSNKIWDEATHPWLDLARVTIDRMLTYEESMMMWFSLNHHPRSIGLIDATSIHDYNSLNYLRANVDYVKKARLWAYKLFGMPKALPDVGPRNVTELTCEKVL